MLKLAEMAALAQFLVSLVLQFNMQVVVAVGQPTIHSYMHLAVLVLPAEAMALVLLLLDILLKEFLDLAV